MRATDWRAVLGVAVAVAVPAASLHALAGAGRHALGLSASPFGPDGLLVAQLVSALPLGWVVATALGRRVRRASPWAWGAFALLLLALIGALGPAIGRALDEAGAGFVARAAVRSLLALALVTPWLVPSSRSVGRPATLAAAAAGLIVATLPPLAFAHRLTETRTAEAASHLDTGRLVGAGAALEALCEIGSSREVAGAPPANVLRVVDASLDRLRREVRSGLAAGASAGTRLDRAFQLIQIERVDEAEALLRPMADTEPDALLLLAALDRDRGRWADCERGYRRVLGDAGVADAGRLVTAYDGLADALRSAGRPGDASAVYHEASRRLPRHAGYFALQLGRHELDAGRPSAALAALSEAVRLDPSLGPRAEPLIRQVRVRTPACLLSQPAHLAVPIDRYRREPVTASP